VRAARGFTLLELLIAIAIFAQLRLVATGDLVGLQYAVEHAVGTQAQ
jgi:prepilin-type N-terminal cleavage/methylation domain-containing protein